MSTVAWRAKGRALVRAAAVAVVAAGWLAGAQQSGPGQHVLANDGTIIVQN